MGNRRRFFALRALLHELPVVAIMLWVALGAHGVLVCVGAALALAALAIGYAPLARSRAWARAYLVDLGAMGLVMLVPLWSNRHAPPQPVGLHEHGIVSLDASLVVVLVVVAWLSSRVLLLFVERRRGAAVPTSATVVSASICAAGLVWMLL